MIVIKLMGGLGNQLFQYALGKKLALKYQTDLALDISFYRKDKWRRRGKNIQSLIQGLLIESGWRQAWKAIRQNRRQYDLGHFALDNEVKKIKATSLAVVNEEKEFVFDASLLERGDNLAYSGYFSTALYFSDIAEEIRADLTLKSEYQSALPADLMAEINRVTSVSIHIRRGDYENIAAVKEFHGLCGLDYYQQAARIIKEKTTNPVFFIFSDDIDWCQNNLQLDAPLTFVRGLPGYADLFLMSLCKHHIIANSTFSWWGAWLGRQPDKIVIAPELWLAGKNLKQTDLFPDNWITI